MADRKTIEQGIKACWSDYFSHRCFECPYVSYRNDKKCIERLGADAIAMLQEQDQLIERLERDLAVTENNLHYYINGND